MSRRTAEANRAIATAWERERTLVVEGNGTRDWTKQQQLDIIEKGKAYDTDGKALEGHHMKNVANFPEYQGNPDNIQFLSRQEHFEAHRGSYQNPTNGYYNPVTQSTNAFIGNELVPCAIIKLSNPVVGFENSLIIEKSIPKSNHAEIIAPKEETLSYTSKYANSKTSKRSAKDADFIVSGFHYIKNTFRNFELNHPIATELIKTVVPIAVELAVSYGISKATNGTSSTSKPTSKRAKTIINNESQISTIPTIASVLEKGTHASPAKHNVTGYVRHMNGKEIHVSPYTRGGKHKG